MLLTFSKKFGDESQTNFKTKILTGDKLHTIRRDRKANPWKAGHKIDFWSGTPRNPKTNPEKFYLNERLFSKDYGICSGVEPVIISFIPLYIIPTYDKFFNPPFMDTVIEVMVGQYQRDRVVYRTLQPYEVKTLAHNDGLSMIRFNEWFWGATKKGTEIFSGNIIHWTGLRYF